MIPDESIIALAGNIHELTRALLKVEARLASIEERLANPRRGWLFQPDRLFAAEEIERRSGYTPTQTRRGLSVVDIRGDYSQYDFEQVNGNYRLLAVDGVELL